MKVIAQKHTSNYTPGHRYTVLDEKDNCYLIEETDLWAFKSWFIEVPFHYLPEEICVICGKTCVNCEKITKGGALLPLTPRNIECQLEFFQRKLQQPGHPNTVVSWDITGAILWP